MTTHPQRYPSFHLPSAAVQPCALTFPSITTSEGPVDHSPLLASAHHQQHQEQQQDRQGIDPQFLFPTTLSHHRSLSTLRAGKANVSWEDEEEPIERVLMQRSWHQRYHRRHDHQQQWLDRHRALPQHRSSSSLCNLFSDHSIAAYDPCDNEDSTDSMETLLTPSNFARRPSTPNSRARTSISRSHLERHKRALSGDAPQLPPASPQLPLSSLLSVSSTYNSDPTQDRSLNRSSTSVGQVSTATTSSLDAGGSGCGSSTSISHKRSAARVTFSFAHSNAQANTTRLRNGSGSGQSVMLLPATRAEPSGRVDHHAIDEDDEAEVIEVIDEDDSIPFSDSLPTSTPSVLSTGRKRRPSLLTALKDRLPSKARAERSRKSSTSAVSPHERPEILSLKMEWPLNYPGYNGPRGQLAPSDRRVGDMASLVCYREILDGKCNEATAEDDDFVGEALAHMGLLPRDPRNGIHAEGGKTSTNSPPTSNGMINGTSSGSRRGSSSTSTYRTTSSSSPSSCSSEHLRLGRVVFTTRCLRPSYTTLSGLYEAPVEIIDEEGHKSEWTAEPTAVRSKAGKSSGKVMNRWAIHSDAIQDREVDERTRDDWQDGQQALRRSPPLSLVEAHPTSPAPAAPSSRCFPPFSTRLTPQDLTHTNLSLGGPQGQVYLLRHETLAFTHRVLRLLYDPPSRSASKAYLELAHLVFSDCTLQIDLERCRRARTDLAFVVGAIEAGLAVREEGKGGRSQGRDEWGRLAGATPGGEGGVGLFSRLFSAD